MSPSAQERRENLKLSLLMIRNRRGYIDVRDRGLLERFAGDGYGDAERDYCARIAPFGKTVRHDCQLALETPSPMMG